MKLTYSANKFSFMTVSNALTALGYAVGKVESFKATRSGSFQVTYTNTNYQICSTFVSMSVLLKVRVVATMTRAKDVIFETITSHGAITQSGHFVTKSGCSCLDNGGDYGIRVNGQRVCKHTIAYSKKVLGLGSFSEMIAAS